MFRKNINQIYQLFLISVKEFIREPGILFWAFIFPISLALILGLAFDYNKNVQYPIGIYGPIDKNFVLDLKKNNSLKIYSFNTKEDLITFLKKGKIYLYLEYKNSSYYIYFDKNYDKAKLAYLEILKIFSYQKIKQNIIEKDIQIAGSRYIDYLIPGLIAMGIMNSALWGIGWTFIQMRIKKLLKIFSASPINKNYFFIAFILARGILSVIENLLLVGIISLFFGITFIGNIIDLVIVYIVGYISFSGIAIFAGSRANNTVVGNGIINAITLPMMILSGIFFSYQSFPEIMVQWIEYLPLTILANLIRGIFLEGVSFMEYYNFLVILFLQGCFFYIIGKRSFIWK
ncbi:MAG: ABC transporter permease [Leptospiraceae bacterium]|nr:MAG: ABC transporter permease [Leptospiraceae bacterium]